METHGKWVLPLVTQQMAMILLSEDKLLPKYVARQKAMICGQNG